MMSLRNSKWIKILAVLLTDLELLANVIHGEAPNCPMEHQVAVAAVVLNRVADPRFPDTVAEVIGQKGQYSQKYLEPTETTEDCIEAAQKALDGEHNVPGDVIYQANFVQGDSVWMESEIDTGWYQSTTYFCRG